jgi:hypothetical protein
MPARLIFAPVAYISHCDVLLLRSKIPYNRFLLPTGCPYGARMNVFATIEDDRSWNVHAALRRVAPTEQDRL